MCSAVFNVQPGNKAVVTLYLFILEGSLHLYICDNVCYEDQLNARSSLYRFVNFTTFLNEQSA